jgi:urate oxidase
MGIRLDGNQYGKSEVRVLKIERGERHRVRDLTVDVTLRGDFDAVHVEGNNAGLPATDTMRNVVYAFAAERELGDLPAFGAALVAHFLALGPVRAARVRVREHPWARLDGGAHPHAFQRGAGGTRVEWAEGDPAGVLHAAGVEDLLVLKTTASGFSGFDRDRFTTLPETDDRILATLVSARWDYEERAGELEATWPAVRDTLLTAFADHHSPSVQFTLHRMGRAVLEAHAAVERIHLSLPNRHHLPVDVARFGIDAPGAVFEPTTAPFGLIEATVERE